MRSSSVKNFGSCRRAWHTGTVSSSWSKRDSPTGTVCSRSLREIFYRPSRCSIKSAANTIKICGRAHTDINSGFPSGTYKCNLYADTQYEKAGYNLPNIGGSALSRALGKYPPGAQSLSSLTYSVPGWPVVSGPAQPGDLLAYQGHVGIATGSARTISASPGGVVENDWGSRQGQKPVIRRCTCP